MVFTDLERPLQQGFLTDIRGIVRTLLQDMDYVVVEEDKSIITDEFVEQVIVYLEKTRFFQKWIEVDFSTVELTETIATDGTLYAEEKVYLKTAELF